MFRWLKGKGLNGRVRMCVKETLSDLEQAEPAIRAGTLCLMAISTYDMYRTPGLDRAFFHTPSNYPREALATAYAILEDSRNQADIAAKRLVTTFERQGVEVPEFIRSHFELQKRAMNAWMSTLGAGILTDCHSDVAGIWRILEGALTDTEAAAEDLIKQDKLAAEIMGTGRETFGWIESPEQWSDYCSLAIPHEFEGGSEA